MESFQFMIPTIQVFYPKMPKFINKQPFEKYVLQHFGGFVGFGLIQWVGESV